MSITFERLGAEYQHQTVDLLGALRVSFMGVASRRMHVALVRDALADALDCRIAREGRQVIGLVLAAPSGYWTRFFYRHPLLGAQVLWRRLTGRRKPPRRASAAPLEPPDPATVLNSGLPPRTWQQPGDAWRIVFVGTAAAARGRGIAAALYRAVMADRSLVARVALDNAPSLRLHAATGWSLYRDAGVALAVHLAGSLNQAVPGPAAERHATGR